MKGANQIFISQLPLTEANVNGELLAEWILQWIHRKPFRRFGKYKLQFIFPENTSFDILSKAAHSLRGQHSLFFSWTDDAAEAMFQAPSPLIEVIVTIGFSHTYK